MGSWFSGFPFRRFCAFVARLVIGQHQINMADAERAGEMEERHDRWITSSPFETTHILLREAGDFGETLLSEAFFPA